jgi:hypothetical protein
MNVEQMGQDGLDSALLTASRSGGQIQAIQEATAYGQSGGRRRRKGRKGSKGRKSRKGRKGMRGGSAPVDSPDMLLDGTQQEQAVMGMNPEWKLAENPGYLDPLSK